MALLGYIIGTGGGLLAPDESSSLLKSGFMKIESMKFGKLRVPLKAQFKTALRTVDHVEDVVVILETAAVIAATAARPRPR